MKKCDIAIIGAGSAGLTAARLAAQFGVSVVLFEKKRIGGDCLYTGCVPSKSLIAVARDVYTAKNLKEFGIKSTGKVNYQAIRKSIEENIIQIRDSHDSRAPLEQLGIQVVQESAKFTSPNTLKAGKEEYRFKKAIIATGSSPRKTKIKDLDDKHVVTSDNIWAMETFPKHLVIVGAGPVGLELGQAYAMLGTKVTIVEKEQTLLPRLDPEVSDAVMIGMKESGVNILLDAFISEVREETTLKLLVTSEGKTETYLADKVLIATGRTPNTSGLGLKNADIDLKPDKGIVVNHNLQTSQKSIYAVGDCVGGPFFTHWAAEQGANAIIHALIGNRRPLNWDAMPWALFTTPEIAHVGANEQDLQAKGIVYEQEIIDYDDIDKAVAESSKGRVSVLLNNKRQVLGATIIGDHASELIGYYATIMANNDKIDKIVMPVQAYPTFSFGLRKQAAEIQSKHKIDSNWTKILLKLRGY